MRDRDVLRKRLIAFPAFWLAIFWALCYFVKAAPTDWWLLVSVAAALGVFLLFFYSVVRMGSGRERWNTAQWRSLNTILLSMIVFVMILTW